ncbi:hypothetical protein [Qipengyuania sp. RANM35]|uniref:hypothetical protein n=1 Tax=Qipengyuania sp. RANM35 TaxID=3068635 RepID=UPI0034DAC8C2
MLHRRTAKLASWQIHLLCWSGAGLFLTGVAWLLLHYFGQVEGEFGPEMSPVEPWALRLHGLFLIPALLGIGAMFVAHIPKGWNHKDQRVLGILLGMALLFLISSGYLLYYAGGESLRAWTSVIHWMIGLILPAIFAWHYWNGSRLRNGKR